MLWVVLSIFSNVLISHHQINILPHSVLKGLNLPGPNTTFPLCQTQKPNNNNLTEYSPEIEEHELKQNLKTTAPGKYLFNENEFSRKSNFPSHMLNGNLNILN